jgi:thiamine-monophosphate kinase
VTGLLDPDAAPAWLAPLFAGAAGVLAGVGDDDCGVLPVDRGHLVVSTDFINARPICLELGLADRSALGRLVVAHNVSDLCGSGAEPIALLVGIMAERGSTVDDMRAVMEGVRQASADLGVPVIGGDTKLGRSWAIYGVAVGVAPDADAVFLKNRARPGQDVWLSGPVGDCCGSLLAFQDDAAHRDWATRAIANPVPPLDVSRALAALHVVRAGTDISDGLAADLGDLCAASGIGAEIEVDRIPVSERLRAYAATTGAPPWAYGLVLGGDVQFLATADPRHRDAIVHCGMTRIGTTTATPGLVLRSGDIAVPVPELGHRDERNLRFTDEARHLLGIVADLAAPLRADVIAP